jgi:hypothetical protein
LEKNKLEKEKKKELSRQRSIQKQMKLKNSQILERISQIKVRKKDRQLSYKKSSMVLSQILVFFSSI